MAFGISAAAKSLLREIHATGALAANGADSTFCGQGSLPIDSNQHRQVAPAAVARRLSEGGFDVVMVPSLLRIAGPFETDAEASEAAAVRNMELRAERIDAAAIKRMAERDDWWREQED